MSNRVIMDGESDAVSQIHEMEKYMAEDTETIANLQTERDSLAAECMALAERLRGNPEMREVIRELREINHDLKNNWPANGRKRLADLLRRLDESQ